ncbi:MULTISPECIES: maleylpyruvate isomerase N-terminal domain-containing protein [unclassified Streptomyces]|uniref:maleylpyruvate isomerase N-terminal domain-containing protein n=1 Tax=unclassified Streptomyces TaxID=2593676 RepID=UPI00381C0DF9
MTGPLDGGSHDDRDPGEPTPFLRIPGPRPAGDDQAPPEPEPKPEREREREPERESAPEPGSPAPGIPRLTHKVLKSLLGAWALSACSAAETGLVEDHLTECAPCAEEALRLRDAVGLLHAEGNLDLDPLLRSRVLEDCLGRRPARVPVPGWAAPYDAETARLDALLRDIGAQDWHAPVRLQWFENERAAFRRTTVAGVMGHLMTVDGVVAAALGLEDPLGPGAPAGPTDRTETFWRSATPPPTRALHEPWREQNHALIRTVSFAGRGVAELSVTYGEFALPLRDALLERAFECWIHGTDIAEAVAYPYKPPSGPHLRSMIDLGARLLPAALALRRRAGLAGPAQQLVAAGSPGRSLHLLVEGVGGGDWYIPLDSPAAVGCRELSVGQVALDAVEFCQVVAGRVSPEDAAAGQDGDREAIRDVLFAAAAMSRL